MLMGRLRAGALLAGFILSALLLMPVQAFALRFCLPLAKTLPNRYHRFLCKLLGIHVTIRGVPYDGGACLIAANHTSWLDIPVMASLQPSSFVAKSEVAGWPFFGTLAKLQQTVFVERERRTRTAESRNEIHGRISGGDRLILFPEGTSSDGNHVLPFKSALMSVAQLTIVSSEADREEDLVVQPMSVAYVGLCGIPMGRQFRPFFAWYGDMELFPHLWKAFSLGPIEVIVEYHKPVTIREIGNRKALAAYCEDRCREGVARALLGRSPLVEPSEAVGGVAEPIAARKAG
jgi:1-acyl-sn-glycerol-3-phosphate acyltransferase